MEKNPDDLGYPTNQSQPPPYYPAQPNPDMQYAQQQQPIITIIQAPHVGGESTNMICPHCGAQISTRVKHSPGTMAHISALLLCLFGCWLCCCIPYLSNSCMDADHECPNCNRFIAHYKR